MDTENGNEQIPRLMQANEGERAEPIAKPRLMQANEVERAEPITKATEVAEEEAIEGFRDHADRVALALSGWAHFPASSPTLGRKTDVLCIVRRRRPGAPAKLDLAEFQQVSHHAEGMVGITFAFIHSTTGEIIKDVIGYRVIPATWR